MDPLFSSYKFPLDSLVSDTVIESKNEPLDMETKENLELWTNVQFTYDVRPGSGLFDDTMKSPLSSVSSQESTNIFSSSLSDVTYESLVNYLDVELPLQHLTAQLIDQQKQQQQQHQQRPQLLLPKISPNASSDDIAKILLSNITNTATKLPMTSTTTSRPTKINRKKLTAEEEKRKRNTAASARFRNKKKQREQSMEQIVREMTEKSNSLESQVKELELEIKFLIGLLIEKK